MNSLAGIFIKHTPVLCGGDGASGGSARRHQPVVPVGRLYQTQTVCLAAASAGRRNSSDCGDHPQLCWHDDVADVDGWIVGPSGNDWTISQSLCAAAVAAKFGDHRCYSCLHTCPSGLHTRDNQCHAHG